MKSETLPPADAASADRELVAALNRRTAAIPAGAAVELQDLERADPYGPDAFAALARRYGVAHAEDGHWQLERTPRWRPDWIRPEHEAQCFDLFETAFGYRIDPALWRWKYRDAASPGMGVWRGDQLVAFYGAMPRPVLFLGQPASTVQIGDVMVHPHERGVMTRSGPFQIAASTFIDRSVGYGRPQLFGFGFPTSKALQVAQKLGLYEGVDQICELTWPAGASWTERLLRCAPAGAQDGAVIDKLWHKMADDFRDSIIGVRDAAYVQERYRKHPTVAYECLLVRRVLTGAPQGLLVLRQPQPERIELMDLVGPRRNFPGLIAAARRWAADHGANRVTAWVTESHASVLAATGPQQQQLDLVVPANVWSAGPSAQELRGRWWLTAGDTDFR
ncbi:GNAT family N-acetyltransferase [Ramlibacter sp.]|uniref:GNAT family N-acetyltransferase n=1 Tax=Ramlibacter sp. TaxID=1917967 RepID=UPI002C3A2A16|nr:GNAT family N-acetyltransferase [Ramlibacter sp.]HWI84509.1 GNAT family N-acetyltransferase [Ramlibacter sp.]